MQYNFSNFKSGLKKKEDFLGKEYSQLNVGRASPMVLDGVSAESYGSYVSIKNIASISIEDPKTLRIVPWDKSQIKNIEKAINASNLGLSVATDTRENLVKILKEKLEEARITVRKEREIVWDNVQAQEKSGKLTEDEKFRAKDELQKIINETNKNLEIIFEKKKQEVMG